MRTRRSTECTPPSSAHPLGQGRGCSGEIPFTAALTTLLQQHMGDRPLWTAFNRPSYSPRDTSSLALKPINSGCKISGDVMHSRSHKPLRRSGLLIREPQSCLHRTYGLQHTAMKCAPQALPLLIRRAPYSPNGQTWAAQRERENHGQRQKCRKPLSAAHINHPSLPRPSHTSPRKVRKRLGLARQS
jgi:hypothetical protein